MSDLISRGKLFNLLAPVQTLGEAYGIIQEMPTVDAVPERHGHWIDRSVIGGIPRCECSECETESLIWSRYCHNCGARMDGKGNGNETD